MNKHLKNIQALLTQDTNSDALFEKAREVRASHFNNEVFVYGVNFFSTYCSKNCAFCGFRAENPHTLRYRNGTEQVVEDARRLADTGVHLIDLSMGEDPYYLANPERLVELISAVHEATQLPVMVSPGIVDSKYYLQFKQAGAAWYSLYQETFESPAYARLRLKQDFEERLQTKREAHQAGLLIEEGILTGWGDTAFEIAHSLLSMERVYPSQVRAMTLVPQEGTPMGHLARQDNKRELIMIAVMRLLFPDKLIPASLDAEGPAGLEARLNAGANVITSLVPSRVGVAKMSSNSAIEGDVQSLSQVAPLVARSGLKLAPQSSYKSFIHKEQTKSKLHVQTSRKSMRAGAQQQSYQKLAEA